MNDVLFEVMAHSDERGELFELYKFIGDGQVYYSTTKPNAVRGGHYHTRKVERFCVIGGKAELILKHISGGTEKRIFLTSEKIQIVEIPVNHCHWIRNIGNQDMLLLVASNEIFNPSDQDTYKCENL